MSESRVLRAGTTAAVLFVAAIAAIASYIHIEDLAVTHGQTPLASYLLPLSIDGTVACTSLVMVRAARAGLATPPLARLGLVLSVAATLAANVAYGIPHGATGALISGWPAVAFLICAEMAIGAVRRIPAAVVAAPSQPPSGAPATGEMTAVTPPAIGPPASPAVAGDGTPSAVPVTTPSRRPSRRPGRRPSRRRTQAGIEAQALTVLSARGDVSGAELARQLGVSERTGQRLLARLGERAGSEQATGT